MLNKLIIWSLGNRPLVIGISILLLVLGYRAVLELPVEVLPDLTKPTVTILTEAPGLAPEEVETRVTQPIESALMGVGGLTRMRSNTDVALSLVFAEFAWGTDIYKARMMVQERMQGARDQLPEGAEPFMTPVASLMGEILLVGVRSTIKEGEEGYLPPTRDPLDCGLDHQAPPAEHSRHRRDPQHGRRRETIEIQPDPCRMQANGITFEELENGCGRFRQHHHRRLHRHRSTEIMVRNLAMTVQLDDIADTVIKKVNDRPIAIQDVAKVVWGIEPMRGDATLPSRRKNQHARRGDEHHQGPGI